MTKKELKKKIKSLGKISNDQRNQIICSLIGHSNIVSTFFGYVYCGRCEVQIGDALGSVYQNNDMVIQGHKCKKCVENYQKATWKDKLFVKDPMMKSSFTKKDVRPILENF